MESEGSGQGKLFRRGEAIFRAGDPINRLYLIQSGLATISVFRGGRSFEVAQIGVGQFLGEEALWGARKWSATAVANNDVRAMPLELNMIFDLLAGSPPLIKIFLKGLIDKEHTWWRTLISLKTETDPTPCAPSRVTTLFAVIYHAASYTGTVKKGANVVVWPAFKKYCQRTFLESPVRLEAAVYLLVRLGAAKLEMIPCETDPDSPDELGFVHFTDLEKVREFYEFYRTYYFRPAEGAKALAGTTDFNRTLLREIDQWNKAGKVDPPVPATPKAA